MFVLQNRQVKLTYFMLPKHLLAWKHSYKSKHFVKELILRWEKIYVLQQSWWTFTFSPKENNVQPLLDLPIGEQMFAV